MTITSASGKEMRQNTTTNKDIFDSFTKEIKNNTLEVKVTVKNLQFVTYTLGDQYFTVTPQFSGEASALKDYYVEYDASKTGFNKTQNRFFSENEGEQQIKFASPPRREYKIYPYRPFPEPPGQKRIGYKRSAPQSLHILARRSLQGKGDLLQP